MRKKKSNKNLSKKERMMRLLFLTLIATALMLIARYLVQNTATQVCYIIATVMYIIVLIRLYRPKDADKKEASSNADFHKGKANENNTQKTP